MKTEMVIGKYTLESLTNGMYSSPLDLYREYIQNAVDSIDEAVARGLINSDEARIDIAVNEGTVFIASISCETAITGHTIEVKYPINSTSLPASNVPS